jgi:iron-sulfur cluster assembly accessory protein
MDGETRAMTEEIKLTDSALEQALMLKSASPDLNGKGLRLYLEGKGCDGFYYGVTFDTPTATDLLFSSQGIDILVDPETLAFVKGSVIDWIADERGQGFLVENPNHRKFRGKFFKRQEWQSRLGTDA